MQCVQCGRQILCCDVDPLPPWCLHCGANIGPESTRQTTALPSRDALPAAPSQPQSGDAISKLVDGGACPACEIALEMPEGSEEAVLSCPDCGQCLRVPRSWAHAAPAEVGALHARIVSPQRKLPRWCSLAIGALVAAPLWLWPGVSLFARLALTMLGAAIIAEGVGRLRIEAQKRVPRRKVDILELPERMAEGVGVMGSLRAVFRTGAARGTDALAIALLGLSCACGGGYLVDLLHQGPFSFKLLLATLAAFAMAIYAIYRAVLYLVDRWCVLIFTNGLICLHRRRIDVHFREFIAGVSLVEIGDAIDERAVEIRLKSGRPPLRFTCTHFSNLDCFGDRMLREFSLPPASAVVCAN